MTYRVPIGACLLAVALAVPGSLAAQTTTAEQRPSYRSAVNVVLVDLNVIDAAGRPVRDLTPADFDVRVDGSPRRTLSADLVEYVPTAPGGDAPAERPDYSTNEGFVAGRSVLMIIDVGSFRPGEERPAVVATGQFLETLSPTDRVAVAGVPLHGSVLGFTTDRTRVRSAVERLGGLRVDPSTTMNLSLGEALRIGRGDQQAWREFVLRECVTQGTATLPPGQTATCSEPGMEPECPCPVQHRMRTEVNAVARRVRYDAEQQARGILDLLEALRDISGRKIVILISQGIFLDELPFDRSALAVAASKADARVHVIQIEQSAGDSSSGQRPQDRFQEVQLARNGLGDLAEMMGGRVYRAFGNVESQCDRIWAENTAGWRLAVDPESTDLDGKPHRLEVKVRRSGLTVYSRSHFIVERPNWQADSADERLRSALRSPLAATALPLRLTHYTSYDRSTDHVLVRLVAEMSAATSGGIEPKVAFVVINAKGEQVAVATRAMGDKHPDAEDLLRFSGEVALEPGTYLIKFAAIAADGRLGSLERRLDLAGPPPHAVALGDVVVSELSGDPGAAIDPVVLPSIANRQMIAYVSLFPPDGEPLEPVDIAFEIANGPDRRVVASVHGTVRPGTSDQPSSALAAMSLGGLPGGEYAVRAVLQRGETRVDGSWRPFRIVESGVAVTSAPTEPVGAAAVSVAHELPPLVDPFDAGSVLGGEVMRRTVTVLEGRPAAKDQSVAAALTSVAAGRFDADAITAPVAGQDPALAAMLRGFERLAAGRADEAVGLFKDALREAPDLTPALVYVGACYAAGGHDREAAGAWQTALIEQRDFVPLYSLLADALIRAREPARAAEFLTRALARSPDDLALKRRRAIALAAAGKRTEALAEIDGALATAPGDSETACAGFRLDLETSDPAGSAGTTDGKRLKSYAQACAGGSGAVSAFASRWLERH